MYEQEKSDQSHNIICVVEVEPSTGDEFEMREEQRQDIVKKYTHIAENSQEGSWPISMPLCTSQAEESVSVCTLDCGASRD